ncbi:hypothetical protein [Natronorubrum daqingense]|nr:hypothetical protein [Natronorubrum daqingense]
MTGKLTTDDSTEAKIADLYADTTGTEVEVVAETGCVKATVTGFDVVDLDSEGHVVRRVVHLEIDDKRNAKITIDDDGHGRFSPTLEYETCEAWKTHTTCEIIDDIRRLDDSNGEKDIVTDGGEDITAHVDDETIESAINSNDGPDHPDAWTVDEIRDLLAWVQQCAEEAWDVYMDQIEDASAEVVYEDGSTVVLSTGDFNSVAEELEFYDGDLEVGDIAMSIVTEIHHELARERCDYSWSVSYPFVARKPDGVDDGQDYVEAIVNGLQRRGLTPGQAWAYYGVEIRGNSQNRWGNRKGDHDHKNVSDALEKAKQKLP